MTDTPHDDYEVFSDPSYFDMWCLRPSGSKDFNLTMHFMNEKQANHASHVAAHWKAN